MALTYSMVGACSSRCRCSVRPALRSEVRRDRQELYALHREMAIARIDSQIEKNGEAAGSAAGWVVTGLRTVVVVVVLVVGAVVVGAMGFLAHG